MKFTTLLSILIFVFALTANCQNVKVKQSDLKEYAAYWQTKESITDLKNLTTESFYLIRNWVHIDHISETPGKNRLVNIHANLVPSVLKEIKTYPLNWPFDADPTFANLGYKIEDLFAKHKFIMDGLNSFESYDNPYIVFDVLPMVENGGEIDVLTRDLLTEIGRFELLIMAELFKVEKRLGI